ncbi:Hypothetical protein R9X50_00797100 [Acrodontium crateriforme]|uniref:NAD(P)-binding domain-containing protein n=1 Tax=Acrodontium crateriforme TaxID=150365 RepID=A0AAQ3MEB8_9PEZI|nr:Hypothetical protein R9X50_00797100 [Acrodontium crateriforme]
MSSSKIAFFGATGDCAGYALANALNDGHDCIALVRTPAKLTASLKAKGAKSEAMDNHMTIVQGDVKDVEAVSKALKINGTVVDYIVSGIGSAPKLQWSFWCPVTLQDPTICQSAGKTILAALQQLKPTKKPVMVNVMTTGIPPRGVPWDVPFAFAWIYRYALHVPHVDKEVLQRTLIEHVKLPEAERGIKSFTNIKASLLVDGESLGLQVVRDGVEDAPAVGYTIRRSDVGLWIYERILKNGPKTEWANKGVCITY